jgi:hypothetical protein
MQSTTQKYVLIDNSGSTGGHTDYWRYVLNIILEHPTATFIFWDSNANFKSFYEAQQLAKLQKGGGCTEPQCFVPFITSGSHIILITDGQIYANDVKICDDKLNGKEFSAVDVHFYNTGGQMNLSVSAPFTRKTKYNIFVDGKPLSSGSSLQQIDVSVYNNEPQKFVDEAETLLQQIVMQNLGRANNELRNDLLNLQQNLLKTISKSNSNSEYAPLRELLVKGEYNNSINEIKNMIIGADSSLGKKIESIIQEMIRQCSGSSDFSFNLLETGRLARAKTVTTVATEELPSVENYTGSYECPVTFENDLPVCFITQGIPVLHELEKGYLDNIMTNPLIVLNDNILVEKIKHRVDHLVGLEVAKELFKNGNVVSPLTRSKISCALTFDMDKSHIKSTNYALANIFFGQKLVGNAELWLAVLYFVVKQIPYLSSEGPFMDAFKTHMMERMRTINTNITLSGLPIDPLMKCPTDIAIWYCVVSPFVINNGGTEDDARNRLRSMGNSAKYLVELVEMFSYPFDKQWTLHRMNLYKVFAWMMHEEKNNSQWRTLLRSQYQNSLTLDDGLIVPLDGPAVDSKPQLPSCCDGIELGELVALSHLVDRTKSIGVVMIPLDFKSCGVPDWKKNYGYPDDEANPNMDEEPMLSEHTFRPVVIDRKLRKHWVECSEIKYGPLKKQLSNYNYFIKYVHEFGSYPTKQEYLKYIALKQSNREDECNRMDTLPRQTISFVDCMFENYEKLLGKGFSNVSAGQFKRVTYDSMTEIERARLDGSDKL